VETKASRSPLGDQRGELCEPLPVTSGVWVPVSVSISQIELRPRSVMMSNERRA
jgi:hypothetical protein